MDLSNESLNALLIVPAGLSIASSFFVILTYLKFDRLREYRHIELTIYVIICDLIASIVVVFGKVKSGSSACWIQSIVTNYSFLCSVFWTAIVAYQIYVIVQQGRLIEDLTNFHRFCWLSPIVIILLPFTTNNYGQGTDAWCFLGDRRDSPSQSANIWEVASFFGWLWLVALFISYLMVRVIQMTQDVDSKEAMIAYRPLYRLAAVPIILLISWTLPSVLAIYRLTTGSEYEGRGSGSIQGLAAFLPSLQGFVLSISFFLVNSSARSEWVIIFKPNTSGTQLKGDRGDRYGRSSSANSALVSEVGSAQHGTTRSQDFAASSTISGSGGYSGTVTSKTEYTTNTSSSAMKSKVESDQTPTNFSFSNDSSRWLSASSRQDPNRGHSTFSTTLGGAESYGGRSYTESTAVSRGLLRANLNDRDSYFERGSERYWSRSKQSEAMLSAAILGGQLTVHDRHNYT